MARKVLAVLMMLGFVGALSATAGCNTVAGAGQDIERGGQKVTGEGSAEEDIGRMRRRPRSGHGSPDAPFVPRSCRGSQALRSPK